MCFYTTINIRTSLHSYIYKKTKQKNKNKENYNIYIDLFITRSCENGTQFYSNVFVYDVYMVNEVAYFKYFSLAFKQVK